MKLRASRDGVGGSGHAQREVFDTEMEELWGYSYVPDGHIWELDGKVTSPVQLRNDIIFVPAHLVNQHGRESLLAIQAHSAGPTHLIELEILVNLAQSPRPMVGGREERR
jgi:hypothetical protein